MFESSHFVNTEQYHPRYFKCFPPSPRSPHATVHCRSLAAYTPLGVWSNIIPVFFALIFILIHNVEFLVVHILDKTFTDLYAIVFRLLVYEVSK